MRDDAGAHRDAGGPVGLGDAGVHGGLKFFGASGPSGGTVMVGGGYVLFGETGEVPGTSGLSKSTDQRMVGGVLGRVNRKN